MPPSRSDLEAELRHLRVAVFAFLNAWESPAATSASVLNRRVQALKRQSGWTTDTASAREEAGREANAASFINGAARVCPLCENDGYVEQWTHDDHVLTYECPRLNESGHAPFNATGILDASATVDALDSRIPEERAGA